MQKGLCLHRGSEAVPFSRAAESRWENQVIRWDGGRASLPASRWFSSQSKMGSRDSGSCLSRVPADVGGGGRDWPPPVEIPTDSRPRRTTAGKRKVLSSRLSATFTGMERSRHSWATAWFSWRSSVAATAKETPLQQLRDEGLPQQLRPGQLLQLGDKAGGAHQHPGAVVQQHPGLPGGHRPRPPQQGRFLSFRSTNRGKQTIARAPLNRSSTASPPSVQMRLRGVRKVSAKIPEANSSSGVPVWRRRPLREHRPPGGRTAGPGTGRGGPAPPPCPLGPSFGRRPSGPAGAGCPDRWWARP